ncbi:hypothetical protein [Streptomyces alfalfae]|uniref:hypothetical protein n=1 Tax=Streptomyces alfalfae TaxID=1642299 RepID=UPI00281118A7|nr:hypothetical protein [Streptomyces alfalfae]
MNRLLKSRTVTSIARDADVSPTTVWGIQTGRLDPILRSTAAKLLAVRPAVDDNALVDSTGAVRRLRALVVMAHRQDTLADELGCSYTRISDLTHGRVPVVTAGFDRAVRRVYGRLWMFQGPSVRGRARAERYGWHGPLAWDDDTIDDPNASPMTDAPKPVATEGGNVAARWLMGESVILDREARREVLQYLFEWTTDSTEEIAARLDMTSDAAERQWHRLQAKAAGEGRRLWRRTWALRDKNLTKTSMGEAA